MYDCFKHGVYVTIDPHCPIWETALLIRRTEETLLELFHVGKINGTLHTCIGQEFSAVAICRALRDDDVVFSNHRGHGHFLAKTGDLNGLIAEIMGKETGVCGGIGGSQHLHAEGFFSNGVLGGMLPVAAGMAYAQQLDTSDAITTCFSGDGALGQGIIYETLNIISKWNLPLLIVIENNHIAQSTDTNTTMSGSIQSRARAFDLQYRKADIWNTEELLAIAEKTVQDVRTGQRPIVLEIECYRLSPHSKGEDDYRSDEESISYLQRDPLNRFSIEYPDEKEKILKRVDLKILSAIDHADSAQGCSYAPQINKSYPVEWKKQDVVKGMFRDLLSDTFVDLMKENPDILLLGEDVESPYGGAFKITREGSSAFPTRVRNTPISEAAITGIGTGLALAGKKPVVEIMFGDFLTLTYDQLQQHACKFHDMYNGAVNVPLIIRTPVGGYRGYGPTHSQSLEKHFFGIPGLKVIALNDRIPPGYVYRNLIENSIQPALVLENKQHYSETLRNTGIPGFAIQVSDEKYPTVRITPAGITPNITLFCYGGMLEMAEKALEKAFDMDEVICEIICPTLLYPLHSTPLLESVSASKRLLVIEEGPGFAALGSEVAARIMEYGIQLKQFRRLSCDSILPADLHRELELLPSMESILHSIREMTK